MHSTIAIAALSSLGLANAQSALVPGMTGQLGNADITTNNPAGLTYTATLPDKNTTTIRGYFELQWHGVKFNINLFEFTDFAYPDTIDLTTDKTKLSIPFVPLALEFG